MKKLNFIFFLLLFAILKSCSNYNDIYNVMSFNIRLDTPSDGINNWENRKEGIISIIKNQKIDILGVQEALPNQIDYLAKQFDGYSLIGQGRDGGNNGEYSAILYNETRLMLNESGTFWLSETPNIPSIGWDAALNRIVTFGEFKVLNSNKKLVVYNSHFDHIGETAREKSADIILNHIEKNNYYNSAVVVMGDFNAKPYESPIKILSESLNDSFIVFPFEKPIGTFNGFEINSKLDDRIDYIFSKNIKLTDYIHVYDKLLNGLWPSDHLPVVISFSL